METGRMCTGRGGAGRVGGEEETRVSKRRRRNERGGRGEREEGGDKGPRE